ncbi:hypothetical protein B296_00056302 [Ensete ventricosum]|uniref:Uncharacterized protein n=1 Tax=Ensete ventricosum TaxID=4639 RepID=A0A426XA02_ENSVE|nr:hypothetical protein B296_00056302 [Ensete ventricosum]
MKKCDSHKLYANRAQSRVRSVFRAPPQKFKILTIPGVLAHEWSFDQFSVHRLGNSKYWSFPTVEFRSVFRAPSQKFKILAIPDVLDHGKSYEHGFMKKHDGHKFYANRVQSQVRSVFRAPSRKFQILAIPDVLARGKSYEHGLMKKLDGHKLCMKSRAESSFDWFFVHHLGNSKC